MRTNASTPALDTRIPYMETIKHPFLPDGVAIVPKRLNTPYNRIYKYETEEKLAGFGAIDQLRVRIALLLRLQAATHQREHKSLSQEDAQSEVQAQNAEAMVSWITEGVKLVYDDLSPPMRSLLLVMVPMPSMYVREYMETDELLLRQHWRTEDEHINYQPIREFRAEADQLITAFQKQPIEEIFVKAYIRDTTDPKRIDPPHIKESLICTPLRSYCHYADYEFQATFGPYKKTLRHPWFNFLMWYMNGFVPIDSQKRLHFMRTLGHVYQTLSLNLIQVRFTWQDEHKGRPKVWVEFALARCTGFYLDIYASNVAVREESELALRGVTRLDNIAKTTEHMYLWAYTLRLHYHYVKIEAQLIPLYKSNLEAAIERRRQQEENAVFDDDMGETNAEVLQAVTASTHTLKEAEMYHNIIRLSLPNYPKPRLIEDALLIHTKALHAELLALIESENTDPQASPMKKKEDTYMNTREVLSFGRHLERQFTMFLNETTFYHYPILCKGHINLNVIEKRQKTHPWSRFIAWFLRFISRLPEKYQKDRQEELFTKQCITVCKALFIGFNPADATVRVTHSSKGEASDSILYDLYAQSQETRNQSLLALMKLVIQTFGVK